MSPYGVKQKSNVPFFLHIELYIKPHCFNYYINQQDITEMYLCMIHFLPVEKHAVTDIKKKPKKL